MSTLVVGFVAVVVASASAALLVLFVHVLLTMWAETTDHLLRRKHDNKK